MRAFLMGAMAAAHLGAGRAQTDFTALNEALDGVAFGPDPGPCPAREPCFSTVQDLPDSIKAISIDLGLLGSYPLGELIRSGDLTTTRARFDSLAFSNIAVAQEPIQQRRVGDETEEVLPFSIEMVNIRLNGRAAFAFNRLDLSIWPNPKITGTTDVVLDKSRMDSRGITLKLAGELTSPNFANTPPKLFAFKDGEAGCSLDLGASGAVDLENLDLEGVPGFLDGLIDFLIFTLFKGLIEGIACDVIRQLAIIEGTGELGYINQLLQAMNEYIDSFEAAGLRGRPEFEADEAALNDPASLAVNFAENEVFRAASALLNQALATPSQTPGYEGLPAVNEAVDVLLGSDANGVADLPDVKEAFVLEDYPRAAVDSVLSNVEMTLIGMRFAGLNTFRSVEVINNGFGEGQEDFGPPYRHTLLNSVDLTSIEPSFVIDFSLAPGEWVNPSGAQRTIQFRATLGLAVTDFISSTVTYSRILAAQLLEPTLGQFIGAERSTAQTFACLRPAVEAFQLSGLQAAISSLTDVTLRNVFDLDGLVADAIAIINVAAGPTLEVKLPYIMEGFFRDYLNTWIASWLAADLGPCEPYQPVTFQGDQAFLPISNTGVSSAVTYMVNNLVGGSPVTANPLDVNKLLEGVLVFVLPDVITNPEQGVWLAPNATFQLAVETSEGDGATRLRSWSPTLRNLDSIWRLSVDTDVTDRDDFSYGFAIEWGNGDVATESGGTERRGPLTFELPLELRSELPEGRYADDSFRFFLELAVGIDVDASTYIDKNELYLTSIQDVLDNTACALAVVDSQELRVLDVALRSFRVGAAPSAEQGAFSTDTVIGPALLAWDASMQTPASRDTTRALLNYGIGRLTELTKEAAAQGFGVDRATCLTAESPVGINTTGLVDALQTANELLELGTTPQPNPRGTDPDLWESAVQTDPATTWTLDEDNGLLAIVSDALSVTTLQRAIVALASTDSNPTKPKPSALDALLDALVLEDDGSVTLRVNPNQFAAVDIAIDGPEGFKLSFGDVVVRNVDRITAVELVKPYTSADGKAARYSTENTIQYGRLDVNMAIKLEVSSVVFGDAEPRMLEDTLDVTLTLEDMTLEALFMLALDKASLDALLVGDLLSLDPVDGGAVLRADVLACALQPLIVDNGIWFEQLQTFVRNIDGPTVASEGTLLNEPSRDLLRALTEMVLATFRSHSPNLSQGPVRKLINEALGAPSDPEVTRACEPYVPVEYEGDDAFLPISNTALSTAVISVVNNVVGGSPVTVNPLDVNNILEGVLDVVLLPDLIDNPEPGMWLAPNATFDLTVETSEGDGFTRLRSESPVVRNLNSIWRLEVDEVATGRDNFSYGFDIEWGNGDVATESGGTERRGPLTFELPLELRSELPEGRYADDSFRFFLELAVGIDADASIFVDKNDFFLTSLAAVANNTACALAVVDSQELRVLDVALRSFRVGAAPSAEQGAFSTDTVIGPALLAWDASMQTPASRDTTRALLNYGIGRGTELAKEGSTNGFGVNRTTCQDTENPLALFDTSALVEALQTANELLELGTTPQPNPRGTDPDLWESAVQTDPATTWTLDEDNGLLAIVSDALSVTTLQRAIVALASTDSNPTKPKPSALDALLDALVLEDDGSVTLRVNPNQFAAVDIAIDGPEGFKLSFGDVVVRNVDRITAVELVKPYTSADGKAARYSTENTIQYGRLDVNMAIKLEVSSVVFGDAEPRMLEDTLDVTLTLEDMTLEALFMLALDKASLDALLVGDLLSLDPVDGGAVLRADVLACALQPLIVDNGIWFEQLQTFVRNIDGPTVASEGTLLNEPSRDLLRALTEMVLATFRSHSPNLSQGPVRKLINEALGAPSDPEVTRACEPYVPVEYEGDDAFLPISNTALSTAVISVVNNVVGGSPVTVNPLDVNNILEGVLDVVLLPDLIDNPEPGMWLAPNATFDLTVETSEGDGFTRLRSESPVVRNLNSIWRLEVDEVATGRDNFSYGFDIEWGNGDVATESGGTERRGPLTFELPLELRSELPEGRYADDSFRFFLELAVGIDVDASIFVDKNDFFLTSLAAVANNTACALAVVDSQELRVLDVALRSFRVGAAPSAEQGSFSNGTVLGPALLAWDASMQTPASRDTTRALLNYGIGRGTELAKEGSTNGFGVNRTTCQDTENPLALFDTSALVEALQTANELLELGTTPQPNPRGTDPKAWESAVQADQDTLWKLSEDNGYLAILSGLLSAPTLQRGMVALANITSNPAQPSSLDYVYDALSLEDDESVTLRVNPNQFAAVDIAIDGPEGFKLSFGDIVVRNVDQITAMKVAQPYASAEGKAALYSTENTIRYKRLDVSVSLKLEVSSVVFGDAEPRMLDDTLDVALTLEELSLEAILMLALEKDALAATQLGNLFGFNETTGSFVLRPDATACALLPLVAENGLYFEQLQAVVSSIAGPTVVSQGTLLNEPSRDLLRALTELVFATFRSHVPNLTQGPLRDAVNAQVSALSPELADVECPEQVPSFEGATLDLSNAAFSAAINSFVRNDLLNPNSVFNVNNLLADVLSEPVVSDLSYGLDTILYNSQDLGSAMVELSSVRINGMGTAGRVVGLTVVDNTRFGAAEPYSAETGFAVAGPITVEVDVSVEVNGLFVGPVDADADALAEPYVLRDDIRIAITLQDLDFHVDMFTRIQVDELMQLYVGNMLELYERPSDVSCLFKVFDEQGLRFLDVGLGMAQIELGVSCIGTCTSPQFAPLRDGDTAATDEDISKQLAELVSNGMARVPAFLTDDQVNQYLDRSIELAKEECTGVSLVNFTLPEPEPEAHAAEYMWYAFAAVLALFFLTLPFIARCHRVRWREALADLERREIKDKEAHIAFAKQKLSSLNGHPTTSRLYRVAIPLYALVITALFVTANFFTVGVSVLIKLDVLGDQTKPIELLEFTLQSSIDDMWGAKTYWLALIIFVASGAWPHTKSVLAVFAWYAPTTVLSAKRRGQVIYALDVLGKWSLIDAYVLFMLQVAFRFFITTSYIQQLEWLPSDMVVVDVSVVPGLSIYCFVIATSAALVLSHVLLHKHRACLEADDALLDKLRGKDGAEYGSSTEPEEKRSVHQHLFAIPDERGALFKYSPHSRIQVIVLNGLTAALVIAGLFVPVMRFDFRGLAGFAIGAIDPTLNSVTHSAASIAGALTEGIEGTANVIGVTFLQLLFIVFTFLTPVALIAVFLVLYLVPLLLSHQQRLLVLAEILSAWNAILVLLVAVVSAIIQISDLAQWIVRSATGVYCTAIVDPLLSVGVPEEDALCFDVVATLLPTGFVLVAGCILSVLSGFFMFPLLREAVADRHLRQAKRLELARCPRDAGLVVRRAVQAYTLLPILGSPPPGLDGMPPHLVSVGPWQNTPSGPEEVQV